MGRSPEAPTPKFTKALRIGLAGLAGAGAMAFSHDSGPKPVYSEPQQPTLTTGQRISQDINPNPEFCIQVITKFIVRKTGEVVELPTPCVDKQVYFGPIPPDGQIYIPSVNTNVKVASGQK